MTALCRPLPPNVDGYSLKVASFPSEDLSEAWRYADLAALFVDNAPADLPFWLVPCASAPQAGQAITVLGHAGAPVSSIYPTMDHKVRALS